ncbi:MAG: hypothetical protein AAFQ45_11915 [Pseudomonadota bacterium]
MKAFVVAMILMVALVAVTWFGLQSVATSSSEQYQADGTVRLQSVSKPNQ